jgi:hypothetical protein
VSVGDVHIADTFGWPLCGASGPLRGYTATSPRCQECEALERRPQIIPAVAPPILSPASLATPRQLSRIKTFWCEPADRARESLRRYTSHDKKCGERGYHNAITVIAEIDFPLSDCNGDSTRPFDRSDLRWPMKCEDCDYVFQPGDERQHNIDRLYRRGDTGELHMCHELPAGAMYDATWLRDFGYVGADGIALTVVLPDGTHWHVDNRANNCAFPDDNVHRCWGRTGDPRVCDIVVGKGPPGENGGGSILSPGYHGFLGGPNGESPGWLVEV